MEIIKELERIEQLSRLSAGNAIFNSILGMIEESATVKQIENYCINMKEGIAAQVEIISEEPKN